MKSYLFIYEEKKFLVEAETEGEAMNAANRHFWPYQGMWEATDETTFEWRTVIGWD